jgi:hypothetical protein
MGRLTSHEIQDVKGTITVDNDILQMVLKLKSEYLYLMALS